MLFGDTLLNVLLSIYQEKICSLQVVISLLLFIYDHTEHIKINLPFYFSLLAAILVTPFLMFFINVSSWNPGDAFVFSFFAHLLLLLVLVPFE